MRGQELTERYEEMRSQALGVNGIGAPLGLALFLRLGMPAWLEAWSNCTAMEGPRLKPRPAPASLPHTLRSEVALVLAGMVLSSYREVPI